MLRSLILGLLTILSTNQSIIQSINASPYPDYHNYAGRPYQVTYDKRSYIFTSINQSTNQSSAQSSAQSINQSSAQSSEQSSECVLFFDGSILQLRHVSSIS